LVFAAHHYYDVSGKINFSFSDKIENGPEMAKKRPRDDRKKVPKFINQSITHKIANFNFINKRKIYFPGSIMMVMCSGSQLNRIKG